MAIKQLTEQQVREWTLEQKDRWWLENVWRGDMPQLTLRSALFGMFIGGILSATLVGTGLWWATPFTPWQSAGMSLAITLMGFSGGLVMSAIKRDRGIKDFGTLIEGHGGILDRIDSICFAAPVFFHLTRYFFT